MRATIIASIMFGAAFFSCGRGDAMVEICKGDCLKASRQKVARCGDNQSCKQNAAAEYRACAARCAKSLK